MKPPIRRSRHTTVVAYLALFLALGGSAYAVGRAPASSSATIAACYNRRSGDLRIRLGRKCGAGERPITWSTQGEAGPQGQPGGQGQAGPQGQPGAQGLTGATGTVDTSSFYDKTESDTRYLPTGGTAANSSLLGGQSASSFAPSSLFGSPVPTSEGNKEITGCFTGEIVLFAGTVVPTGLHLADGTKFTFAQHPGLGSVLGQYFGGNGTEFAIPDLRAADPKGAGPAGLNYYICTEGTFP